MPEGLWYKISDQALLASMATQREIIRRAGHDIVSAEQQLTELHAEADRRWGRFEPDSAV